MLRAAIVGLGSWGQVLVDAVQENGDPKGDLIRFVRAVTRTPARAKDFANRQGLILTDRLEDALGDDIDAVVLASINSVHVDQIVAAAAGGKHIFVEKPLAFSLSEARRAAQACAEAGVALALGHNRRFLAATRAMKRLLSEEEIVKAMRYLIERHYLLVEGAAAMPVAALLKEKDRYRGRRVALVITGKKVSTDTLRRVLDD